MKSRAFSLEFWQLQQTQPGLFNAMERRKTRDFGAAHKRGVRQGRY